MDYRILGPLEVADGDRRIALGGERQRAVLGHLLLHRNEVVASERLIDELWGERPPPTAGKILQNYISQLRRVLGANGSDGVLETHGRGFRPEEDRPDSQDVAVISHGFWQRYFGGDRGVLGKTVSVDDWR